MPTYEYRCQTCDLCFDIVQSFADDALTKCPKASDEASPAGCASPGKGKVKKVFSAPAITFKGDGFYKNDSRVGAGKSGSATAADNDGGSTGSDSKSSGSSKDSNSDSSSGSGDKGSSSKSSGSGGKGDSGNKSSSQPKSKSATSQPVPAGA